MTDVSANELKSKGLAPGITANDLARSTAFYQALGFVIEERWESEGVLRGVMLRAGNARIGLGQDDWKKGRDRKKGVGMRLWIMAEQDVDEIAERARAAGLTLDKEPYDAPWGSRAFDISDPDGFAITISKEV